MRPGYNAREKRSLSLLTIDLGVSRCCAQDTIGSSHTCKLSSRRRFAWTSSSDCLHVRTSFYCLLQCKNAPHLSSAFLLHFTPRAHFQCPASRSRAGAPMSPNAKPRASTACSEGAGISCLPRLPHNFSNTDSLANESCHWPPPRPALLPEECLQRPAASFTAHH